ncbi:Vesicle-associated membrane protein-associated protein SCS2 [Candida viswanathii]|uniref:Vesicle-associated membrane protein-associated protein SCS2 n=1 Tax=Candida viswanathii TaxID=5486 RepID=A0A367XYK8_9ASCO|nr:Vesicle-associated membrane protein-associated protein SCS2 [Candida viswanathii]
MEVSPGVLEFTGSFTKQTTEYLTLSNPTNTPLAFKVKTTAPKLYCVRPNASIVKPGDSVQISIILQGFSQPLPADYKCKDKFLSSEQVTHGLKKLRVNYVIGPDKPDTHNANANSHGAAAAAAAPAHQQQQQQQQAPVQQSPVQQQPQYTQQPSQQSIPQQQSQSHIGAGIGGAAAGAAAAGAAAVGYNQYNNGDNSFNQGANRSFDTSSAHNGYQQQQQQQPLQPQYSGAGYQQHQQPPQQQFHQGGYQGAGFGGVAAQAGSQPSPELQRELEAWLDKFKLCPPSWIKTRRLLLETLFPLWLAAVTTSMVFPCQLL